jgi:PAS domain S-box-containing protein
MRIFFNARFALQRKIALLLFFSFFSLCFIGWLIYFNKKDVANTTVLFIGVSGLAFLFIVIILLRLNKDIVLRREAELRLKENQAWLQSILDNTTSLMYIKDLAGRYVMVNRRFQEVIGVKAEMVIGHTDYCFSLKEAADHYKLLDEEVMRSGESLEIEEVVKSGGVDVHLLSIKFPLLSGNGQQIGIGGIATDITERVQYQDKLIMATREAQNAKGMQELFLANMSHEIRTPMNGIQGMTDLLLGTPLTDQQMEFAGVIKRSVNNLLVIVNDVLDFSKIKAGKMAIEKIEFRLTDVLGNITAMFAHRLKKKGLNWELDVDPVLPEMLTGDPYRLNQILINLVGNAIKFTEQGYIRLQVSRREQLDNEVILVFSITDSGIGITAASLPHIFDHFSQAGLDISRRYGGTGLGLAICQQLVKLQGGSITASSREGVGTTFSFHLPYEFSDSPMANAPVPAVLADYSQVLAGRRILVAEDNEVNRQLVDHVLQRGGGQVQLAVDGQEAVNRLLSGEQYDLIIMDLQMPVMDGYEATRYIRQEMQLHTPIIAMTATALVGEKFRCFEAGMNDYMTKPFEFTDLYKRIRVLLDQRDYAA